jgi:Ca-activated chloride channel family protein
VEQLAAQSSHARLRDNSHDAARGKRLRSRQRQQATAAAQAKRARFDGVRRRRLLSLFVLAALLCAFAPSLSLKAQSGRRRTEPSQTPEPNTQRPRRATPTRPAENVPGQPATPDAPSNTITAQPTPTPQNNTPRPQTNETAAPASTADDSAVEVDDGDIVRVTSNLVPVSATVTDTRGKAITDLTVEDFELRVDGQPKPIGGLSHAETPVRMVMLFDNSDSIRSSREFEKQAAMRFFKSVLRPVDQAAIYSVGTVFDLVQPLTNDVSKLVRTIEHFDKPEGATKLMDAMAHAAEYLRLMPGRKVLVIVSDGADTISDLSYDETLRRVIAADCQVYAVQTGIFESANLYDLMAVRRLETFSDRTGGAVYIPKNTAELDSAFAQISADLAQQYVLSYYPTDEGRDGRFRVINLRVKTRPHLRVRARRGYYPRINPQQLSALPERFVNASEADVSTVTNASASDQPLRISRELASRDARSTITPGARAHGGKNMDSETSGDAPARVEMDVRVRPTVKPPEPKAEPKTEPKAEPKTEPKAELKTEAKTEPPPSSQSNESPPESKAESSPDSKPQSDAAPSRAASNESKPTPTPTLTPTTKTTTTEKRSEENSPQASTPQTSQLPATQSATQVPLNVGQLNSKALSLPRPLYPAMGKQMKIEGVVRVAVLVDESGKVVSARAESGHMMLRASAINAAQQARFAPTLVSGQPVPVSGFINYTFSLKP